MATKPKKTTAAAPAAINLALLTALAAATAAAPFYMHVSDEDAGPLVAAGYAEANPSTELMKDGMKATRISTTGLQYLSAQTPADGGVPATGWTAPAAEAPAAAPAAAKPVYAVVSSFVLPEKKRVGGTGGARPEVFPFSKLEAVGAAFFIPATAEKPNPEKSYASTVASASDRYATDDTTKPMTANRKNRMAHPKIYARKFAIRRIEDGAAFGFPGVAGAAVGRII